MPVPGYVQAEFTVPSAITLSATRSAGGTSSVTVTAGPAFPSTFGAILQAALNAQAPVTAGTWSVTFDVTTGKFSISVSTGTFSWATVNANLASLMGLATTSIATTAAHTAANQARGFWRPDCVLNAAIEARRAPVQTDHRNQVTPTGEVLGLVSQRMLRHSDFFYSHVPRQRTWEASAVSAGETNASYERFITDTQIGGGHSWFSVSSRIRMADHNSVVVGSDGTAGVAATWQIAKLPGLDTLRMADNISNGLYYRVEWPELVGVV